MKITTTSMDSVEVLSVAAEGGLAGARIAFEALEARLPGLSGRRFFGVLHPNGSYRACVARQDGDDPRRMSLEAWTLPGGRYARTRIDGWPERTAEIGSAFRKMAELFPEDTARPSIEFYRSQKELILLLPIAEE